MVRDLVGPDAFTGDTIIVSKGYGPDDKEDSKQTWAVSADEAKALTFVRKQAGLTEQEEAALAAVGTAPTTIKQLREQLGKVTPPTDGIKKFITYLDVSFRRPAARTAIIDALDLPKFIYFDNYDRLPGLVNLDQLAQRVSAKSVSRSDEIVLAFLGLAELTIEDVRQAILKKRST